MSMPLKQLEAEALELSLHERARLAQRLIASLDEDVGRGQLPGNLGVADLYAVGPPSRPVCGARDHLLQLGGSGFRFGGRLAL